MTYIEHLDDKFHFGKFRGCTFAEVAQYNPDYLRWVVENVSGSICVFDDSVMEELRVMFPHIIVTASFENLRSLRMDEYQEMEEAENADYSDYDDYKVDYDEQPTYDEYSGSYAQDVMGYSDDDIDTIFDGDPSAYWNID